MIEELEFPTELKLWKYQIERVARRFGLDFDQVMYILVNPQEMSEIAARHGMPNTPHHWSYGQDSIRGKKSFRYGHGRIYELVVNTSPNYAYLMHMNDVITQKAVMAHVCGHVDFFKNSAYFGGTDRKMVNAMAADAIRIEKFGELYGRDRVEQFYDWALAFEHFADVNAKYWRKQPKPRDEHEHQQELLDKREPKRIEPREQMGDYMDDFLNPQEWVDEERERLAQEAQAQQDIERGATIPPKPTKDIMGFLTLYAPLEDWQRDIVRMVRRHWQYFAPQARTKVMNEGWATFWEEEIMTEMGVLGSSELFQFADELAGVTRKGRGLNPYRLGYDLWRDIKFRWDTGRHGAIWEDCPHLSIKGNWDEFAVFKSIGDKVGYDTADFRWRWAEFSSFLVELRAGNLKIPKEFFTRNLFTTEYVTQTWVRYQNLATEYARFSEMLEKMEPLELQAALLAGRLIKEKPDVPEKELRMKARRDAYNEAGQKDLWCWTTDEVNRQLTALKALIDFRDRYDTGGINNPEIPIPSEWFTWAERHSDPVKLGLGTRKLFEVRSTYDDVMFLEEFFTKEFCEQEQYFLYKAREMFDWETWGLEKHYIIDTRSFRRIKKRLLWQYTNFCLPVIEVVDANFENSGALYLVHRHEGVDMDFWSNDGLYMQDVLQFLFYLWGGKNWVYLETISTQHEEPEPLWYNWHNTEEPVTEEDQQLIGETILFGYGLDENGVPKFTVKPTGDLVLYTAPF